MHGPRDAWKDYWGESYDRDVIVESFMPVLKELDRHGKIGSVVADIGSGYDPVSALLPGKRKIISVDFGGHQTKSDDRLHLNVNLKTIGSQSTARQDVLAAKVAKFLGIDPMQRQYEQLDSLFFSAILNYVDYKSAIQFFSRYLKPGGRIIIINKPERGLFEHFHKDRLKSNRDLYDFLTSSGFEIEEKVYHGRPPSEMHPNLYPDPESKAFIMLVARKVH